MRKVEHIKIKGKLSVNELIKLMGGAGVMGSGRLARAVDILEEMIKDKECKVFFGQAGAMVPGGMRSIISDFIRNGFVDVFVCTGASLTHDLVEALGYRHEIGNAGADDAELHGKGKDRMWDSYMPNEVYGGMEDFFEKYWDDFSSCGKINELLWKIGSKLKDEESILYVCYKKKVPIFCPALSDSGIGLMIWGRKAKGKKIQVDAFEDMNDIMDLAWTSKKAGVFYVGGGVPKNFIQQAMQLSPRNAEYGVQISTDRAEYGGSSGASLKEGVSWGKMNEKAKFVDVYLDATVALPLIYGALIERFIND